MKEHLFFLLVGWSNHSLTERPQKWNLLLSSLQVLLVYKLQTPYHCWQIANTLSLHYIYVSTNLLPSLRHGNCPKKAHISEAVKQILWREKNGGGGGGKEIGDTGFSSAQNTRKTYRVHSHMALACVSHWIVNRAAGCYSLGIRLQHIFTHFCAMF